MAGTFMAAMNVDNNTPAGLLPWTVPLPADARRRRWVRASRVAAYVLVVAAFVAPAVQFQHQTMRNLRKAGPADARGDDGIKRHKGAIGRWRFAAREMWEGKNIYRDEAAGTARLHPNMPFTVILLTPFAYLPVWAMALSFNVLKLLVLAGTLLMVAAVANHDGRRMPDWVLGLALLWTALLLVGDIQHGNTNVFVLGAIVLHLWLYRRGHDLAAGGALALAICLKMTPALFVLYWLYQRNWKLLGATVAALVLFVAAVPAAALGPDRYATLTGTWLNNLIIPGLLKGAWYPIHINQSISGVFSRYFLDGANGDIFWNPDDNPYAAQVEHGWITLVALSPAAVKMLIRDCQVIVVALTAWAIGWRRLPRDDGRRALHYGLIALGMLLLNQRTWDHHAGVALIAAAAIFHAIAFGRVSPRARRGAFACMLGGGLCLWLSQNDLVRLVAMALGYSSKVGKEWADWLSACGPTFFFFLGLLAAGVILSAAMKRLDAPYAVQRQTLAGG